MKHVVVELRGRTMADAVAQSLQALRGETAKVEVLLSGALARPFMFGPVAGLKGWHESHAAARAAAPALSGIEAGCEVRLECDPSSEPALATAVGTLTLDAVYAAADSLGVTVSSIRPLWAWALEVQTAKSAETPRAAGLSTIVVTDVDSTVLIVHQAQKWRYASSQVPALSWEQDLIAWLRRVQLEHDLDGSDVRVGRVESDASAGHLAMVMRWAELSVAGVA
jgi:hypothetical protein